MKYRSTLIAFCLALIFSFAVAADSPKSAVPALHELTMNMVAKIHVGISTRAQLRELLGTPWRTTNYGDCNPVDLVLTCLPRLGRENLEDWKAVLRNLLERLGRVLRPSNNRCSRGCGSPQAL